MDRQEFLNDLQLHNDLASYEEVNHILTVERTTFVLNSNQHLLLEGDVSQQKFLTKSFLVD